MDSEQGWESVSAKGIYFPTEGEKGDLKYRLALGLEWIKDLGDQDKNIALYADGLVGISSDSYYDWGIGTGLRFKY